MEPYCRRIANNRFLVGGDRSDPGRARQLEAWKAALISARTAGPYHGEENGGPTRSAVHQAACASLGGAQE